MQYISPQLYYMCYLLHAIFISLKFYTIITFQNNEEYRFIVKYQMWNILLDYLGIHIDAKEATLQCIIREKKPHKYTTRILCDVENLQ